MRVITKIAEMKAAAHKERAEGKRIGLVPTMGFFHEGHLSLVRESLRKTDCTVVSLFVNPTQFGPQEDFKEYPRDLDRDRKMLEELGADLLFVPDEKEMYPERYMTYVEVIDLQDKLCGRSRPGHFRGVCTVVLKLFEIVRPDEAFFGQKDAQQALIIQKMVRDLDLDVEIGVLPIVREEDGLALSSRNIYLDGKQRKAALCLVKSLREAEHVLDTGERDTSVILRKMKQIIGSEPLARIDYLEIVDLENLEHLDKIEKEALIALAVFIGRVRLIDNMMVRIKE
jgi:pantoate--beta-alanine ligase